MVNVGINQGVGARIRAKAPYVLVIHCAAHRLELAVKDVFKNSDSYKDLHRTMQNLHNFCKNFNLNSHGLKTTAATMVPQRTDSRPPKVDGTRWVAFVLEGKLFLLQLHPKP